MLAISLTIACSRYTYDGMVLFFPHIPFVVNHTINATPLERLQQHPLLFTTNHTPIARSLCEGWTRHDLNILVIASFFCDQKSRAACAQSFAPWQQATIEIMLAISLTIACSRYTYDGMVLFFLHIPFGVNHTINATPPERWQHYLLWKNLTGRI